MKKFKFKILIKLRKILISFKKIKIFKEIKSHHFINRELLEYIKNILKKNMSSHKQHKTSKMKNSKKLWIKVLTIKKHFQRIKKDYHHKMRNIKKTNLSKIYKIENKNWENLINKWNIKIEDRLKILRKNKVNNKILNLIPH